MQIYKVTNSKFNENCYILAKDGDAIVIDPGIETDKILKKLADEKLAPKFILLTHGHIDHIFSCKALKDMGARVYITEIDAPKLLDSVLNLGFLFELDAEKVLPDGFLLEGKNKFLDEEFEVVFTPGHTSGSCVIIYKDNIFTGDTYFEEGIYGRCDLLDGNQKLIEKSIEKIKPLLEGKNIYAGHE